MKKYFLSFCDSKYNRTLERIKMEAINMNIFDEILCYNETIFDEDFTRNQGNFIKNNKRGYGYWIWKPYLILKTLKEMNENDILVYVDGGCTLNKNGIKRLNEYFEIITNSKYGILSLQLNQIEKMWTKMDLFVELKCKEEKFMDSNQLLATTIIMRKCNHVLNIFEKALEICSKNNYHFIDDSPSISPNDRIFNEHRHDQSILSLLRKKYGTDVISDETWCKQAWSLCEVDGTNFPIWATRKKY
jgi:hypothetical protein